MSAAAPRGGASRVFAGILLSRVLGLVRQRAFAHWFGDSDAADALGAAFRIPNVLQNLLGEGVLSASFIPVYARLRAEGRHEEAGRVAGAVGALLGLTTAVVVLVGILASPWLVALLAPGFTGDKRELTVLLLRLVFPGLGALVMAAWCLGVLNSHRRFFLSYAAPAAWNVVLIAALVWFGPSQSTEQLAVTFAWASVVGALAQFVVQLPTVLRLDRTMRAELAVRDPHVRQVLRAFGPVVIGRGVSQVSAYVDSIIASLVGAGAVALLNYAQVLSILPVSLFGMSVSAAELPAMASAQGDDAAVSSALRSRLGAGIARIAFFTVPSAMAFLAFGDVVGGALYRTGAFGEEQTRWLWTVLAGSAVGLVAATLGRLYASGWYALRDTRTPLRFALARVAVSMALGGALALLGPRLLGVDARWGVAGLTAGSGLAAWLEYQLLRRSLERRLGAITTAVPRLLPKLWGSAAAAALLAAGFKWMAGETHPVIEAGIVLPIFGTGYLLTTLALRIPEAESLVARVRRALGG